MPEDELPCDSEQVQSRTLLGCLDYFCCCCSFGSLGYIGERWWLTLFACLFVCYWDKVLCIQSDPKLLIFLPQHVECWISRCARSGLDAMPLPHVSVWPLVSNGSTHCCEDQGSALSQTLRQFFFPKFRSHWTKNELKVLLIISDSF